MKNFTIADSQPIFEEIKKAKKILMHCHPNADGDSLGSVLGLYHLLAPLKKDITIIAGDTPAPEYLSFLPGFDKIVPKNYFEINPAEYDLFLILDTSNKTQISRKGPIEFPPTLKTIVIDHHIRGPDFTDMALILNGSHPAVGQILTELAEQWGLALNRDAALCLFIAIYTDTFGFSYQPSTSNTLLAAAKLTALVPDFTKYLFILYNSNTKGRILFQRLALDRLEEWFDGQIAVSAMSFKDITDGKFTPDEMGGTGDIGNLFKSAAGWNIGIVMVEEAPGAVKVSLRSRDPEKFNVAKVAMLLGGGGHPAAAGTPIKKPLPEAKEILKKALETAFPFLKNDR